jgi:hypothetical protein
MDRRICTFDDATHTYYLDGVKMISVTQLLTEQGIKTDFSKVPINPQLLAYASMRGTALHEEIQHFVEAGIEGISDEFQFFKNYVYPLRENWFCEVMLYCDDYCGRCDLIGVSEGKELPTLVIDTKTGSSWTKDEVAWQTSLYARCMPELVKAKAEMKCLDLKNCKLVDLERVPESEIQKMLDCHKAGTLYKPKQLVVAEDKLIELTALEQAVASLETTIKELTTSRDEMREEFRQLFAEQGVKEFETDKIKITYVAPTTKDGGVDRKKLEKDFPEAFEACHKAPTKVKDYIKITLRSAS